MCANILLMFYWLYVSIAVVLTFWKKIAKVPNKEDVTELPLTLCADGSTFSWITCSIGMYYPYHKCYVVCLFNLFTQDSLYTVIHNTLCHIFLCQVKKYYIFQYQI